jgi:hypothetical protein
MGSGGSSGPDWALVISGQTGGRIIPGTHYGMNTSGTGTTQAYNTTSPASTGVTYDYRTYKLGAFGESMSAPGGGAGQPGMPGFQVYFTVNTFTEPADGILTLFSNGSTIRSMAGTGGGWGAKGGDMYVANTNTSPPTLASITVGGAGGKAVNTNGFAVTWLGGQDRAYGVVG